MMGEVWIPLEHHQSRRVEYPVGIDLPKAAAPVPRFHGRSTVKGSVDSYSEDLDQGGFQSR